MLFLVEYKFYISHCLADVEGYLYLCLSDGVKEDGCAGCLSSGVIVCCGDAVCSLFGSAAILKSTTSYVRVVVYITRDGADDGEYQTFYWREGNNEVDFVLVRDNELLGLEVKSGKRTAGKGLAAFKQHFPKAQTLVIGTGGIDLELFFKTQPEFLFR